MKYVEDNVVKAMVIVTITLILSHVLIAYAFYQAGYNSNQINIDDYVSSESLITENNVTYKLVYENYYNVSVLKNKDKTIIEFDNPCIEVVNSTGVSMKPFRENKNLAIFDNCFPVEDLEVGDVISFYKEWTNNQRVVHRIIDIDFEDRWIRTKGDNPVTNKNGDDIIDFNRYYAKDIGFLNVLEDKNLIKKEVTNLTNLITNLTASEVING